MSDKDHPLDCGNNPCFFAVELSGVRTQGRCRCLDELRDGPLTSEELRALIRRLRLTIKAHVEAAGR